VDVPPADVLLLAGLAILVGSAVQGVLSFGLGLLAAPILVLVDASLVPCIPAPACCWRAASSAA